MSLEGLELHWVWLIVAALLAIAEIVVPGVFLIFLAAAAALTGLAAVLGLPFAFQLALFPLLALGAVQVGRRAYARSATGGSDPLLNDRTRRLVGETVVVVGAIEHGRGRVRVGDSVWPAQGPDAAVGTHMRVTGADGTCLRVEALMLPGSSGDM